jgi:hypothetical protein
MGIHFGILAGQMSSRAMLDRIAMLSPEVRDGRALDAGEPMDLAPRADWPLVAADHDGQGWVIDSSYMLSGMEPDLITTLARESGKLVVGVGVEPGSGTFVCVAARADAVLRHYYQCNAELKSAYSWGTPFASEAVAPLTAIDGAGILGVLSELGFDYAAMQRGGARRQMIWTNDALGVVPEGPLARNVEAHRRTAQRL